MSEAPVLSLWRQVPVTGAWGCITTTRASLGLHIQAFGPRSQALSVYDKIERHYLEQDQFFIKTGHENIKFLLEQRLHTSLQQKGIAKLLGLDYKILYSKGVDNRVADAFSRRKGDIKTSCYAIQTLVNSTWMTNVLESYQKDMAATEIMRKLSLDKDAQPGYQLQKELLWFKGRIYVGENTDLRKQLLELYHN